MSVRQCVAMTIECADVHFHGLVYRLAGLQETFCTYEYHFELVRAAFSWCGFSANVCAYMYTYKTSLKADKEVGG